ncbi:InlB B-repeat-containing protein [Carboxylicivirga marina]|uniref:InlB B-repeat-containing protein n=1 Tax=Carboxylicivirga marina TaxID=2800988 RepID=UPI002591AC61|nr:InlB B-repeat-containing protein [uncultured Carboxylicivirga sp.]
MTNIVIPDNVSYLETRAFDYNPINSMTFENAVDFQGMRLPLLKGYTCYGWYENPDFTGEPVNYVSALTAGEVTYWVKRQLIEYAIDYKNTEAHEVINHPTSYNIESNAIAIDEPLPRDGYTFAGWYTDAQLTAPANLPAIPNGSVGDKTFYAAWEQATSMNHLGEEKIGVYPNPATDFIYITTDYEQVQFSLLDVMGKQRIKKTITNNSSVNLKGICEPGMFIVQIYVPETKQYFTKKLIVE